MKKNIILCALILSGCAQNSGVISMGNQQYMLSRQAATGFSGLGTLKAEGIEEATLYCRKKGKSVVITNTIDAKPPFILGNFPKTDVYFKCVEDSFENQEISNNENKKEKESKYSTGTGFAVNSKGVFLTNQHVVDDCDNINVTYNRKSYEAYLMAYDPLNDIAALKVEDLMNNKYGKIRNSHKVRNGEDVITLGYPLTGILSDSIKTTYGSINSTTGIRNDINQFQFNAPIQQGNSGGPLLDIYGNIIGITSSKLNDLELLKMTGTVPQNVNFSIKSSVFMSFLENYNIDYTESLDKEDKNKVDIIEEAQKYTVLVSCK